MAERNLIEELSRSAITKYLHIWVGLLPDFVHNEPELPKGGELVALLKEIGSHERKHYWCCCEGCGSKLRYQGPGSANFCSECGWPIPEFPKLITHLVKETEYIEKA